ncbi:MAG: hypothetical protein ACI4PE_02320 [Bacilli bacterium]
MEYIKKIIKTFMFIFIAYVAYVILDNSFNIFDKFKTIYIIIIILLSIYINIDAINFLINKIKDKDEECDLFNIYYVNFPKVYEIAMLIDNKLKTQIEKKSKEENSAKFTNKLDMLHENKILKPSMEITAENQTVKSLEYKEVQEVKNTNSTILKIVKDKAKRISNLKNIKNGQLIIIDNVKISIINKEEILQVNSMVSGALKDNVINADAGGQNLKIDVNALSTIFLKDYKYQLCCENKEQEKFYVSIPMKLEKEFENDYCILDLEIGTVNIIGIYREDKYKPTKKSSWDILQTDDQNMEDNELKNSNGNSDKSDNNIPEPEEKPYIDLIAIVQELKLNNEEENNE